MQSTSVEYPPDDDHRERPRRRPLRRSRWPRLRAPWDRLDSRRAVAGLLRRVAEAGPSGSRRRVQRLGSTPRRSARAGQVGNGLDVIGLGKTTAGKRASWQINAPSGFSIVGAHTVGNQGMVTYGVDSGMGWGGGFYWQGGGAQVSQGEGNYSSPAINSPLLRLAGRLWLEHLRWDYEAGRDRRSGDRDRGRRDLGTDGVRSPGKPGAASGWVRGSWPIAFSADGPSGACQLAASLGGASVSQPLNEPQSQTTWHQCSAGSFSQSFNTAAVGSGFRRAARDVGTRRRLRLPSRRLPRHGRDQQRQHRQHAGVSESVGSDGRAEYRRRTSTSARPRPLGPQASQGLAALSTVRRLSPTAERPRRSPSAGSDLIQSAAQRTTTP